jgi:hypothetical protein
MLVRRSIDYFRRHDWFAVFVELFVVVVGLLLAFQIDRWWEQRGERIHEAEYVARLITDVESDIPVIQQAIELAKLRKGMVDVLMRVVETPTAANEHPIYFIAAVQQAAFTYSPNLTNHTFDDMRSTGNLRLLREAEIKKALFSYYDFDQDQKQYRPLQFLSESRHFELAAGILSHDQARLVQDTLEIVQPGELDNIDRSLLKPDDIQATVQRFLDNEALIEWLPETRQLQVEQLVNNEIRLANARNVLKLLRDYSETLELH